jgi:uncharacterized membrane protein YgcG
MVKLSSTRWRSALSLSLCVAWLVCWTTLSFAQTFPPLDGVVADDTGRLEASAINSAAGDLQKLKVKPLVVMVSAEIGPDAITDYAYRAIRNYGLGSGLGNVDRDLLAIVVSLNGRQSTLIYGGNLSSTFARQRNNRTVSNIVRDDYLNKKLQNGDYTGAFVDSLRQAAFEIQNPPPTLGPSSVTNVDTSGIGEALIWIVGGLVVLGALAVVVPLVYKRWKTSQETAARRRVLQEQLTQARNVTADMITDLDFPVDPSEQLTYRFLALALERERPQQLSEVRAQYDAIYDRVSAALARYDATNKGTYSTEEEMTSAISQYQGVQSEIKHASEFLQKLADLGRQVEEQIRAAPGEVDAAKKALAAAAEATQKLAAAAPDLQPVNAQVALRPVLQKVTEAEQALAARPPLSLRAYDNARAARPLAEKVVTALQSVRASYASLAQSKAIIEAAHKNGFKVPQSTGLLSQALSALSVAVQQIEKGEFDKFSEALKSADALTQQATQSLADAQALQVANAQALDKLKADGESIKTLIQQGAEAFDKVDEYAESSWQDIRGNGTEAQRAADEAYRLWEEASALNTVSPESPQDFARAKDAIDEANRLLQSARTLIAAIFDRLKHLDESKRIASAEIEAAQRDITAGRAFISKYDPDISPSPDKLLDQAEEALRHAQSEIARPKPDWISVVAHARKANDLADKALTAARNEEEAMQARRQKVQTLEQQALASLSRAANFASVHRADLDTPVFRVLEGAKTSIEGAQKSLSLAESTDLQDAERAHALDEAAETFGAAQQSADEAYNKAASQFAALESLRRDSYDALQNADNSIRSAAAVLQEHSTVISANTVGMLQAAIDEMPEWRNGADLGYLRAVKSKAEEVEQQAERAHESAEEEVRLYNEQQGTAQMQDLLGTLLTIGAATVLSGSGRSRQRGWGSYVGGGSGGGIFGSSGGSSGGGWSSGGGSDSGGWGGGGSDSGGWGGGGSDSGGWGGGGSDSGGW